MTPYRWSWVRPAALLAALGSGAAHGQEVGPLLSRIQAVSREGQGNVEAGNAWRALVRSGVESLPSILGAFDSADVRAANYLRLAVDAIAERELAAGRTLPADKLETFVNQRDRNPRARRLAYEWLTRVDPTTPARLLPGMLDDPSPELRRDAVVVALKGAEEVLAKGDKPAAIAAFQGVLKAAREKDQVDQVAKQLKAFGVEVDLAAHFGFIRTWHLAAPFENRKGTGGYEKAYPPERGVDLNATYEGKPGAEKPASVRWVLHTTNEPYGMVDLNKAIGKEKGAVAYAYTVVEVPSPMPVEMRLGCICACKVFLNGELIFGQEEYHHGIRHDQYVARTRLRAGPNELLVKVCQNEQTEAWAQNWQFQLRLCDGVGTPAPLKVLPEGKVQR